MVASMDSGVGLQELTKDHVGDSEAEHPVEVVEYPGQAINGTAGRAQEKRGRHPLAVVRWTISCNSSDLRLDEKRMIDALI